MLQRRRRPYRPAGAGGWTGWTQATSPDTRGLCSARSSSGPRAKRARRLPIARPRSNASRLPCGLRAFASPW